MRDSEDALRAYAREKHFGDEVVRRWSALDAEARGALLDLAERLRLGENQLRDFLDQLEDLAARNSCGVAAVLREREIEAALRGQQGRNETIRALRAALRRLRYPQLTDTQRRLEQLAKALRLPSGVHIEFPENLEGEHLSLTLRARSAVELTAQARALLGAAESAEVAEMFRQLEGIW